MNGASFRKSLIVLLALILYTAFMMATDASEPAKKRGDYPRCQTVCLDQLEKRMTELSEGYKKTGDRLAYQERVEQAGLDYDRCIQDCKELLPVK